MKELLLIAKAVADESRLRVLVCLDGSTLCLCHLTEILGLAASTVSKHLAVLSDAGLLISRQESRWHYYRWAGNEATPCVKAALAWVREFASGNPLARNDAARRAIVLQSSTVPCPQEAHTRVLFLCTGNSCRSQMAEAMLRKYAGGHFEVYSAGLIPKPIHEMTFEVMDELEINIRHQQPTGIMEFLGKVHFGHLITVCSHAEINCPVFPGIGQRLYWPTKDPAKAIGSRQSRLKAFREARDELQAKIFDWLHEQGIETDEKHPTGCLRSGPAR